MCVYVNRVFHLSEHANYAGGWFPRTTSPLTTSSSPPPLTIYYSNPSVCFFQCQCSTFVKPLLLSHENQNGRVLNAQKQKMNDDDPLYEDDWLGSETVTSAPTKQNKRRKKFKMATLSDDTIPAHLEKSKHGRGFFYILKILKNLIKFTKKKN